MSAPKPEPAAAEGRPRRDLRAALLAAAGAIAAMSMLGSALMPYLAVHQPLVLLALNPWPRHQLLVAPHTPLVPFLFVVTARTVLSSVIGYELAARYGTGALDRFAERAQGAGKWLRKLERGFRRAAVPMLVLFPGPVTAAFGALSNMRRGVVFTSAAIGQAGWAYLNYRIGALLAPWTKLALELLEEHVVAATLASVLAVGGFQWFARRRRLRKLGGG